MTGNLDDQDEPVDAGQAQQIVNDHHYRVVEEREEQIEIRDEEGFCFFISNKWKDLFTTE